MILRRLYFSVILLILASLVASAIVPARAASQPAPDWQAKVDATVLEQAAEGTSEFLIIMNEQADLSGADSLPDKQSKGRYVYNVLTEMASRSQSGVLNELRTAGAQTRSYWVANLVWVRGSLPDVQAAASRSDVYRIVANPWVRGDLGKPAFAVSAPSMPAPALNVEWNLTKVGAPFAWEAGITGEGVVIGGQDTGYDWDHPALIQSYRGWDGSQADHNYNWHDAIREEITPSANPCGLDATAPCDDYGHGTHTMGIMVGDDGAGSRVGMAPRAHWIGCRNMESGYGRPSTYIECYQWFLAPTDLNNQVPNPDLAPHVINNSWGCPPIEGCADPAVMETVVDNLTAAGILTVHSAGNSGSVCGTVSDPAAIYANSFTVGNTTNLDSLASSSSRGPVGVDGSGRRKPDVSAPGTSIRSSFPGTGYVLMTGTSMAAPHVAGLAALLISANPGLAGQPATLRRIMEETANPSVIVAPEQTCGDIPSTAIPNNQFGWGRINAADAVQLAGFIPRIDAPASVPSGAVFTATLYTANWNPAGPDLSGVSMSVSIPPATTFITATLPHLRSGDVITWTVGSLAAGSVFSTTLTLRAPVDVFTIVEVTAETRADMLGVQPNSENVTISALQPRLSSQGQTTWNTPFTYTLTIRNAHPSTGLTGLSAASALPDNAVFINASQPYTLVNGLLNWQGGVLSPGEAWEVIFSVLPSPDAWRRGPLVSGAYSTAANGIPAQRGELVLTALKAPYQAFLPVISR